MMMVGTGEGNVLLLMAGRNNVGETVLQLVWVYKRRYCFCLYTIDPLLPKTPTYQLCAHS
jgi:hypothetical protein